MMTIKSQRSQKSYASIQGMSAAASTDLKRYSFSIFDDIKPDDIRQGAVGNCYFLSCLSSIAEYPERIKKIFLTDRVNKAGCYAMKFHVDGVPREIVVDDRFCYDSHKEEWAFSRSL